MGSERDQDMAERRSFAFALAVLALCTNSVSAVALRSLPDEKPLNIAFNLSLYCGFAAGMSALGVVGALRRSASLLAIFANHLLLDALLSSIPRLLLLPFLTALPAALCDYRDAETGLRGGAGEDKCARVLGWVQAVVVGFVVAVTVAQSWAAIQVKGYAEWLGNGEEGQEIGKEKTDERGEEKCGLEAV
ncbi:hypothetical protein BDY21DRAFT_346746 [Lineolata rhizophorae]|uniref:Uncharacterized protein n=1 Tax=Lineolata rhizophorae TaxID=578093 RepID=A0A6A6NX49_9PEZI|nr:hypothetical protein BDY21DRAFT_346746 [Lineolata rhizophorae]